MSDKKFCLQLFIMGTRPGEERNCKVCGKSMIASQWDDRYCSQKCGLKDETNSTSRGTYTKCKYCKSIFQRSRNDQKYCSQKCQMVYEYENGNRNATKTSKDARKARRKQGMEKFKENPTTKDWRGWTKVYIPAAHPELEKGWMPEHHFVWWKEHDELPPEDKVIHHKDGDKKNNDIDNLELITPEEHGRIHNKKKTVVKECKICDGHFETIPSDEDRRITCSRECQVKWQEQYR